MHESELIVSVLFGCRDAKVRKSVERIFNIWQERSVYPEELITELKANLQKKETTPPAGENGSKIQVSKRNC